MQSTAYASHKAQAVIFEYLVLLFAAVILSMAIVSIKEPHIDYNSEVYSCILTSYYGKITCKFPKETNLQSDSGFIKINGRKYAVPYSKGECHSKEFIISKGEITCLTQ